MRRAFEELDYAPTPLGAVTLRRRWDARLDRDVLEVMLRDEHLISDVFTASEVALAELALAVLPDRPLRVVVGGLGLGYTAQAALADPRVRPCRVIEYLEPVIRWHREGLAPLGPGLLADDRFEVVTGDFFAMALSDGFGGEPWDAVLIDIDHAPDRLLGVDAGFYAPEGLARLARYLAPGGVVALWSDDVPDERVTARLRTAFGQATGHPVTWPNPYAAGSGAAGSGEGETVTQTVYLAQTPARATT